MRRGGFEVNRPAEERDRNDNDSPLTLPGIIAAAARLYGTTARTLVPLFLVVGAAISLLYQLPLPGSLLLPLWFVVRIVLPAIVGSGALALSSVVLRDAAAEGGAARMDVAAIGPVRREVLAAGLLAGMVSLAFVVFLRGLGLLLLPLAYGPPILVQIIAVEAIPLQAAWSRTRSLMRRNWTRVLFTLLVVVLLISILAAAALATVFAATEGMSDATQVVLLGLLQAILVGITLPYLAAVEFVTYSRLVERSGTS